MSSYKLLLVALLHLRVVQAWIHAGLSYQSYISILLISLGAYMNGCVYYAEKPSDPINVSFQVGIGGTQCMDHNGTDGSFTVTDGGVTCYSIGYVENKPYDTGIDNCAVRYSYWAASYNTNMSQSGSTSSYWTANYHGLDYCEMYLLKQSNGTNVCGSAASCNNSEFDWSYSTTPTYYVS